MKMNQLAQEQAEQYRAAAENLTKEIDGLREEVRQHTMNMENCGQYWVHIKKGIYSVPWHEKGLREPSCRKNFGT